MDENNKKFKRRKSRIDEIQNQTRSKYTDIPTVDIAKAVIKNYVLKENQETKISKYALPVLP